MNYVCQTTRQIQQKNIKDWTLCLFSCSQQEINLGVSLSCKCLEIGCLLAFRWVFIVFKCVVVTVVAVMTGWERTVWTVA